MRFLADQGISPKLVSALVLAGHDAIHVRSMGLSRASDADILGRAAVRTRLILEHLPQISRDLEAGAMVVIDDASVRVRKLDLRSEDS